MAVMYIDIYTDANDVGDYWKELGNNGWRQYEGDDKTTTNTFESTYVKGSHYIIIYVCFDLNEVWITC